MITHDNGIHLKGTSLWLDARSPHDLCFVSHPHVDHLGKHSTIIATAPTAQLYEQRMGAGVKTIVLPYQKPYTLEGFTIELLPAGHMLGSAQALITTREGTVLYTGDFAVRRLETAEPLIARHADVLVMEATYGQPRYIFPDREIILGELCAAIDDAIQHTMVPIVVAYSLGKGQEMVRVLGKKGFRTVLHSTIYDGVKVYEQFGISFAQYEKYTSSTDCTSNVLVLPPYVMTSSAVTAIPRKRVLVASGWALDQKKISFPFDYAFPLSDHADFNELVHYVRTVNPAEVFVTHGDMQFVDYVSRLGYRATYIEG